MATQQQAVNGTPTALVGLVAGQTYTVQNVTASAKSIVSITLGTAAPDRQSRAMFILPRHGFGYPTPLVGESVFVWTGDGEDALVAYEESS